MILLKNDLIKVLKISFRTNQYVVSFDNGLVLNLSSDLMVLYQVSSNRVFSLKEFELLKKDSELAYFYNLCLKYISYKLRTKQEVVNYLNKSNLSDSDKERIIKKLIEFNLIDDYKYTKYFLDDCINKLRGKIYFTYHLTNLGVSRDIINCFLEVFDENQLLAGLIAEFEKIQKSLSIYPETVQKLKIRKKLINRGISNNTIELVINSITFSEDLSLSIQKDLEKIKKKTDDYNIIINYLLNKGYDYPLIKETVEKK